MARIRTIKPEFWTDDAVTDCSRDARLLFIGCWNFADDAGNLDRSEKQLKLKVFPTDRINCEVLINELITHGLLIEYSVSGKKYLHIPGFIEHQNINRPSKPHCPTYEPSLNTQGTLTEPSVSTHPSRSVQDSSVQDRKGRRNGHHPKVHIPPDFTITESMHDSCLKRYPDADTEEMFVQFRAYHEREGSAFNDWNAAWTTWLGNAGKFGYPKKTATVRKWD